MHEFRTKRRVEFADTDMGGIVHFSRFVIFMETAEHEFLNALGTSVTLEHDGVRILNPAGAPIGHIHLPERCANLCFGGRHRNRLFMAAAQSLYALYVNTQGVKGG